MGSCLWVSNELLFQYIIDIFLVFWNSAMIIDELILRSFHSEDSEAVDSGNICHRSLFRVQIRVRLKLFVKQLKYLE